MIWERETISSILDTYGLNVFDGHSALECKIKNVIVNIEKFVKNCLTLNDFFLVETRKPATEKMSVYEKITLYGEISGKK